MRRPAGSPAAPFVSLIASSQSPAGSRRGAGYRHSEHGERGRPTCPALCYWFGDGRPGNKFRRCGSPSPPRPPQVMVKAAKSRKVHSCAGPEETSQKACLRAGDTAARSAVLSAGCVAVISRYAAPPLDPSVPIYSTLLAAFSLKSACCRGGRYVQCAGFLCRHEPTLAILGYIGSVRRGSHGESTNVQLLALPDPSARRV